MICSSLQKYSVVKEQHSTEIYRTMAIIRLLGIYLKIVKIQGREKENK